MLTVPIPLPLASLVPAPELFTHASTLHGQAHVSRVMVHAFRLLEVTACEEQAPRLWAAVSTSTISPVPVGPARFTALWPKAIRIDSNTRSVLRVSLHA